MSSATAFKYGDVDVPLLTKALKALIKHHNSKEESEGKNNLLGDDEDINIEIGLLRIPGNPSPRPRRISIPHPLHQTNYDKSDDTEDDDDYLESIQVCIIVKEESKPWVQEMVEKFPKQLGCVKKVLGLNSLRKKYARYDQKRELCSKYDLFMADDRIVPMLGKLLGKKFFETKKQPIPLRLTRKEALPFAVQNCLSSTFMTIPSGRCVSVRVGSTAMSLDKLVENCKSVAEEATLQLPGKWKNITKFSIKTSSSISLPFYNITPEELLTAPKIGKKEELKPSTSSMKDGKKRSRTEQEEAAEKGNKTKEIEADKKRLKLEKKKKEKDAKKSPLLQALKKQKGAEEASVKAKAKDEEVPLKKEKKKKKKRTDSEMDNEEKVKKTSDTKKSTKMAKLSKEKKDGGVIEGEEKSETFVSAKKFKGAKKGFVFKMGDNGLGYYQDVIPVVNKVHIMSLKKKRGNKAKSKSPKKGGRRKR